ncbi:MAG: peptide deformylase [Armatimonadota bacterium]
MFMRPKTSDELQILTYPAPVLRKKAAPVERVTPQLQALAEDMVELMRVADGVGLAAPQVGISLRIITIEANNKLHILFNPVIISRVGEETGMEGCLSLPRLYGEVTRAERVTVRGLNRSGKKVTYSGEGLWARAVQHEVDHLDGILFVDRALPESLHWLTDDADADGNLLRRATTLDDALRIFEQRFQALRA